VALRHANISVFVPHIGCPCRCSFCDQTKIARTCISPQAEDIGKAVAEALSSKKYDSKATEIAFFGGSFTAIDRDYMCSLLKAAYEFVKNGTVSGIRISTRPDCIDEEILDILKEYGVTAIELGAQSMDDGVLQLNHRGHSACAVREASRLIKERGFSLGLQMMTGLLGDTAEKSTATAREIIALKPDTVRIYPTIVLKDTMLYREMLSGNYCPQTLEEAVELCASLVPLFEAHDIRIIRLGLHEIDPEAFAGGPWHPAFSELVRSHILLKRMENEITSAGDYTVYCAANMLSQVIGQRRANIAALAEKGINVTVRSLEDLSDGQLKIIKETK